MNVAALVAALMMASGAWAGTISTADTTVEVVASEKDGGSIRMTMLAGAEGGGWVAEVPAALALVGSATVGGKEVGLQWHLTAGDAGGKPGGRHVFTFTCGEPALELTSTWSGSEKAEGPVEHEITISNRGKGEVFLPLQTTLTFEALMPRGGVVENWWIEKGAGSPSGQGVHRNAMGPGFSAQLESTGYSPDSGREPIPWTTVYDAVGRRGFYVGIESSGHVRIGLKRYEHDAGATVRLDAGLTPEKDYRTRLAPGETLHLPVVFVGCYRGDVDDGCNGFRRWVKTHLLPTATDKRYPLLVNNSWGRGMAVDENLARKMIDDSADLGLEMFHIDAGWFRKVGDWNPDPVKFPHGLGPVADYAHSKNLKFGLWVGWTQGGDQRGGTGEDRPLSAWDETRRDWFAEDAPGGWKLSATDFTGQTVCLADPAAAEWCLGQLRRVVKEYKLDMLEHDQPMIVDRCGRTDHSHMGSPTDVALRASQAYYRIYDTLRRENPNLLFEDCVNGGRLVDFGVLQRVHYISITDTYDPLSNRRAFWDASYVLPASACECYIQDMHAKTVPAFVAMRRSGMMGWCTIMMDTSKWTAEQRVAAKVQFALYKSVLRPLILNGDLYHLSERPDGVRWDALEYYDAKRGEGVAYVFRGTTKDVEHRVVFKGLEAKGKYKVTTQDGSVAPTETTGEELLGTGLRLHLSDAESSDLVHLQQQ